MVSKLWRFLYFIHQKRVHKNNLDIQLRLKYGSKLKIWKKPYKQNAMEPKLGKHTKINRATDCFKQLPIYTDCSDSTLKAVFLPVLKPGYRYQKNFKRQNETSLCTSRQYAVKAIDGYTKMLKTQTTRTHMHIPTQNMHSCKGTLITLRSLLRSKMRSA